MKVWLRSSHEIVNAKHYVRLILLPFFDQLIDEEKCYGHFMQGNAIACTVNISVDALDEAFSK
jgi:hypothetical protein